MSGPIVDATADNVSGCEPSGYQPQKCPIDLAANPVIDRRPDTTKIKPATYYYHSDHLGSTSWVTDQNGRVHEHVEYFPYGEVWRDARYDSDGDPVHRQQFLFSAKELDEETGLYYFGARYLDPIRARWANTDPLATVLDRMASSTTGGVDELSLYAYVGWSPVSAIDPTGLFKPYVHADIVRSALAQVGGFSRVGASRVVGQNQGTDLDQREFNHFDNNSFAGSIANANERLGVWKEFGHAPRPAADGMIVFPGEEALGRGTHVVEDFYAHSNWVELYDAFDPGTASVPIFEDVYDKSNPSTYAKYAGFRAYLEKNPVKSGTFGWSDLLERNKDPNSHSQMNLDQSRPEQARNARLYGKAFDAAVRATVRAAKTGRAFDGWEGASFNRRAR